MRSLLLARSITFCGLIAPSALSGPSALRFALPQRCLGVMQPKSLENVWTWQTTCLSWLSPGSACMIRVTKISSTPSTPSAICLRMAIRKRSSNLSVSASLNMWRSVCVCLPVSVCVCSSSEDALCESKTGKIKWQCYVLSVMHHGPVRVTSSVAIAAGDDGDGSDGPPSPPNMASSHS